jgi:cyanophycinase
MTGTLALVGGGEWLDGCSFDGDLLARSGGHEVVVLPTAAAYEHPQRLVEAATAWFEQLGAKVRGLPVLRRPDAMDPELAGVVRDARFLYLAGGSSMHLRSVLKDSAVWDALVSAWQDGAVVAGSSAGAMVLCDPMVDARGGAFTLGLGLVVGMTVVPHFDGWSQEKADRTLQLAPKGLLVVGVDEGTAVVRDPGGAWRCEGVGHATAWVDHHQLADLSALP